MLTKRRILYIILLFCTLYINAWERQGLSFESFVYQGGTQNWQIQQSEEGWLYIANNKGLLEFDGYTWSLYPMKDQKVRSLRFVGNKIYAGGSNQFGYFKKSDMGLFVFKSLSDQLNKAWKGDVWNIFFTNNDICILDDYHVYVYQDDKYKKTITSAYKIDCSALINNRIYIGTPNGVAYLDLSSSKFIYLHSDEAQNTLLKNKKIVEILPYKGQMLVVTAYSGIYRLSSNSCEPFHSVADNFLGKNQLFCADIQGDRLALGSVQNGLFLVDLNRLDGYEVFNQNNILKNNTVLSCFFDKDRNLWLGLDNGISYVNLDDFISPLFAKESPIGTGYCSSFYNNTLYLGTNQGLYELDNKGNFTLVKGGEGQIISLNVYDGLLFCCGDNGILVISPTEKYKINISGTGSIEPVMDEENKLIAITYFGLKIIEKKSGKWQYANDVKGFVGSCSGSIQLKSKNRYWQANSGDNFVNEFVLDEKLENVQIKSYKLGANKVSSYNVINIIDGAAVVCTTNGLYKFSETDNKFIPFGELETLLGGKADYQYLHVDKMRNIWFKTGETLQLLPYSNSYINNKKYDVGLESLMVEGDESILMKDSVSAVIGTYNGFSLIRIDKLPQLEGPSQVYIRRIMTSKDNKVVSYGNTKKMLELPYTLNSVNINWGAFNMSHHGIVLFSYRLVGLDNDWSIATNNNTKEYTNLREGEYTFEVRTIINGKEQKILNTDRVTFRILPPWYRSKWAYSLYFILLAISLYAIYHMVIRKKERIIKEKKKMLELQRLSMEEKTRLQDQKIYELEKEKLTVDLQYKTQEMTGYILDISRKNEMFDKIKKDAESTLKLIDNKGDMNAIRRKVSDFIININNNLKHDESFDVFKSNFDIIHKDFFKILESKYPQLTKKDKVLCAYIKMDLVSKEIAPLLNISIRGVEINRYNLRKKMGLNRSVNLSEFLNNLTDH